MRGITWAYRLAWLRGWIAWHASAWLARVGLGDLVAPRIRYAFEHVRGGAVIGRWIAWNLVTTVGKTDLMDKYLKGSGYTAAWYMGLKGAGSAAAGDTLASHGGWTELTPYSGNRKAITWGTTSGGSNTGTAVSFAITGAATVAGAFVCNAASGTSGTLYSVGDFSGSRGVDNGDTLNVTPTLSAS